MQRLTETLKLSQTDPDALFLQITLDDGAIATAVKKFLPYPLTIILQPSSLTGLRFHDRLGPFEVLANGVAGKSRQLGDSTDGQFVGSKRLELNDICFAEHIFETKMWTFAHCARCCLTHSYPLFGMAQFFVVLWKLTASPNSFSFASMRLNRKKTDWVSPVENR